MPFLLVSAQRRQTLHLNEMNDIRLSKDRVTIFPNHLLKQSKPGQHLDTLSFKAFSGNKNLGIVRIISEYIPRTKNLRTGQKPLISTVKPHGSVSQSTVSCWNKLIMLKASEATVLKPHSIREAATSKACLQSVPLGHCVPKQQ